MASRGGSVCSSRDHVRIDRFFALPMSCICDRNVASGLESPGQSQQHGKNPLGIVVIHLDFVDVGPGSGHMMNDRVGQSVIIRTDGGDDDLHGGLKQLEWLECLRVL
jgi:hypothetical protein